MKGSERQVSEIITVPSYRFLKGTELLTKGGRSNSKPSENGLINGRSQYDEEIDHGHGKRFGRAFSCGNEVRIHKTFAHTSGTSDALRVNKEEIKDLIVNLLRSQLGSLRYDHKQCSQKCLKLSEIIETNVRKKCPDCKIVSTVLIGALRDKGSAIASQSLYSERNDCMALAYYSNQSLFASAAVFVVRL
jgi:phage FluMu protein Com